MKINLIELLEETLQAFPQKTAVIDGQRTICYDDLGMKARQLADNIISKADVTNKPIAVFLPKSIESVYTDFGIMYSGNFFMNLDIKNPTARLKNILDLIQPVAIVTNDRYKRIIEQISGNINIINVDDLDESLNCDLTHRRDALIDTDPFCIINTSGSTGTPKGVVLNHRSFFDFIDRSQEAFNFNNDEIIGSLSPVVFDIYVYELCLMMANAATMVVIPDSLAAFPAAILKILKEQKVTYLFWVPTIMVNIANMGLLSQIELPDLKTVWYAGEVFPTKQFNIWRHSLPQTTFANLYGPIEITLDCTFYKVEREIADNEPIPIGYAYKNTDILILDDEDKRITTANVEGELCVRGTSLAMGYYNNPEKTATAFVQNPLNKAYPEIIYRTGDIVFINERGEIVFKGRKDSLVKNMGYRIELGEIEHVIVNTLKLVKNACVVYQYQHKEITLFYENDTELTPADFRKALSKDLPKYMLPTVFYKEEELKRNTNGKIDRLYYKEKVNG